MDIVQTNNGVLAIIDTYHSGLSVTEQSKWLAAVTEVCKTISAEAEVLDNITLDIVIGVASIWQGMAAEAKSSFKYDLTTWAIEATGKSSSHIRGLISVYDLWFSDTAIKMPAGFNPKAISPTKLLQANAAVRNDIMTPDIWEALKDEGVSVSQLRSKIPSVKPDKPPAGNPIRLTFWYEGGYIWMQTDVSDVCLVSEINTEFENIYHKQAAERLLAGIGIVEVALV